jgi:hypothetical protein
MDPFSALTRFGAPATLPAAGNHLRLHAALAGVVLDEVSTVDLAAAIGAAELWAAWTGCSTLDQVGRVAPDAARALLAVLHRAAGRPVVERFCGSGTRAVVPGEWLTAFEQVQVWLTTWVPAEVSRAWAAVLDDLAAAGEGLVDLATALEDLLGELAP